MTKFAALFAYELKCVSVMKSLMFSPNYIVSIQGKLVSYKVLAINETTEGRPFFSILFRDANRENPLSGSILFSKLSLKVVTLSRDIIIIPLPHSPLVLQGIEIPAGVVFKEKDQRVKLER